MSVRLAKRWQPVTDATVARLPGQLGVFQLADAEERLLCLGVADARTRFGLRSAVQEALAEHGTTAALFRVEVTQAYATRWRELLMVHAADHGTLPPTNRPVPQKLGRLSPS